jgi:hypothetical protein
MQPKKRSELIPLQSPGIPRQAEAGGRPDSAGVTASRSCGDLTGPARSICYLIQGISGF